MKPPPADSLTPYSSITYQVPRKGWFSNTSFTTGLKTLLGKVFNPVVKLVLENQPFLMPEPAEKPSLHFYQVPALTTEPQFPRR